MAIKEGYKQTEVGVIPEDWEVNCIGDINDLKAGGTPSTLIKEYWNGSIRWMSSGELNNKRIYDVEGRITELGLKNSSASIIPINSVLIGLAGQGKTRGTVAINYVELCTNQSIASIYPNKNVSHEFMYQYIDSQYEQIRQLSYGEGGRGGLNLRIIKSIKVPIPPLPEQKAIAKALSDIDGLIDSLTKLIEKKKNIKQGAMQELLTGKKRLEGFSGEWERKTVEDIAIVSRGRVISHMEISKSFMKKYPVYSSQTINKGIMGYLDTYDFDGDYITWTTDGVNAGTVFYRREKFNCTNVCGTIKPKKGNYYFIAKRLGLEAVKYVSRNLANPKLMNDVMKRVPITIPPTIDEQTAIANILSDMDSEIEKLQAKLDKYKAIKQGMMQELLTGRIRLLEGA